MSNKSEKSSESAKIHNVRLDSHFTVTSNTTPEDPNLSWAAKGLLWYILSRPPNWNVYAAQLSKIYVGKERGNGRDSVWAILKELRNAGYIVYQKSKDAQGQWKHDYYVYPMRVEAFQKQFPHTAQPGTVQPGVLIKTNLIKNSFKKESIIPPSASAARASTPSHGRTSSEGILSPHAPELLDLYEKHPGYFKERIFLGWIKKFGAAFVLETLKFFLHVKSTQKKPIPNPEAWMESAFVKNYAKVHEQAQENKEFAQNLKKRYNLKRLKINQRYCQDTETGKDFYYNLPQDDFQRYLNTIFEQEDPHDD